MGKIRLVCCYIEDRIHNETILAIEQHWGDANYHVLSADDPQAYAKTLNLYWRSGEGLFVVEPDIVIRADVVEAALYCDCQYGCYPYPWLTDVGPALGCTWFRGSFTRKHPKAIEEALQARITWKQFDVYLMRNVLARQHKEQPHVHLPPVVHLNPLKQLLPGANPEPLMAVPTGIGNYY